MATLDRHDIEYIAKLARLQLTEKEKKQYADELSAVFAYVKMLDEVETAEVPETCQVTGLLDAVREDAVHESDPALKKKLTGQFPENVGNLLKVKSVFDSVSQDV